MIAKAAVNVTHKPTWSDWFRGWAVAVAILAFCPGVRADLRTLYLDNQSGSDPLVVSWSTNLLSFPVGHWEISADLPELVTLSEKNAGALTVDLGSLSGCQLVVGLDNAGNLNVVWLGATKSDFDWFLYGFVFGGVWCVFALAVRIVKQVGHQSPEI